MELILKRPIDKPPCVCILFPNEFQALKFNAVLINSHKSDFYSVQFDVRKNNLDLVLVHNNTSRKYKYQNLQYDIEKLKKFLNDTMDSENYSFCHITIVHNKHKVVMSIDRKIIWLLKLDYIELLTELD